MWDFFETVRHRHSVRSFRPDRPVEAEKIHAILETAMAGPSAGDLQAYHILVVRDAAQRQRIQQLSGDQSFISAAPLLLVFCADLERSSAKYGERGRELYALQDATIATTYAQLAIVAAGLGSTWVGYFEAAALSSELKLSPGIVPVAMLSVGYPAEVPELTPRRRVDEVVTYL